MLLPLLVLYMQTKLYFLTSLYFPVLALYKRSVYLYWRTDVINEIQIGYFPIVGC